MKQFVAEHAPQRCRNGDDEVHYVLDTVNHWVIEGTEHPERGERSYE